MEDEIAELIERIKWQSGDAGDDEFGKLSEEAWKKVKWKRGADYGAPVRVISKGYPDEYGYLMTVPPFPSDNPDLYGVIHLPHTWGEKCDAGPVWQTVTDMALQKFVKTIQIG